ncbi:flippase-like domain-containing protein [Patescibacteria group bacterium]|nr:flippase-like domain-containing protein [Patescibacteria group bacterium]
MKRVINIKKLIKIVGLFLFIVIIIKKIDFEKFYQTVISLNIAILVLASLIAQLPIFIKINRWKYILNKLNIRESYYKITKIWFISLLLGVVTPLNIGDVFGKVAFLKHHDNKISTPLISIIIDRLSDIFVLLILAIIGIVLFIPFHKIITLTIAFALLVSMILVFLMIRINFFKKIFKKTFLIIVPKKLQKNSEKNLKELYTTLVQMKVNDFLTIFGLTIIALFFRLLFLSTIAYILGITQIPYFYLILIYAISVFVMMIPITIAGFGTRELSMLALFSLFSVSSETAIVFSLLMFFVSLIPTLLIGFYFWLTEPLLST